MRCLKRFCMSQDIFVKFRKKYVESDNKLKDMINFKLANSDSAWISRCKKHYEMVKQELTEDKYEIVFIDDKE